MLYASQVALYPQTPTKVLIICPTTSFGQSHILNHPTSLKVALPDASLPGGYSPGVTYRALLPTNLLPLLILDLPTRPSHFYLFVHIPSSFPLCATFQVVSSFTIPSPTI